jgi:hypothetical protein
LAQQVLKRNMAKRKEQSGSEAMDIDNDSAPIVGRPTKAPRQLAPTPRLMHSKHATEVDKGEKKDKGGKDKQREARKPKKDYEWKEKDKGGRDQQREARKRVQECSLKFFFCFGGNWGKEIR